LLVGEDVPNMPTLAGMIADAGVAEVAGSVRDLIAPPDAEEPADDLTAITSFPKLRGIANAEEIDLGGAANVPDAKAAIRAGRAAKAAVE
jgi:hypothetical protein